MAETLMDTKVSQSGDTQTQEEEAEGKFGDPHHHEEAAKIAVADSGDDYSSGSDRSVEIEDFDDRRDDSGSGGGNENEGSNRITRTRRRKRHGSHGSRRHKGGLRHNHKHRGFQPYPDQSEIESTLKRKSLELQEKENAAAVLRREGGQNQFITFPVAPFNSTQFLMDEHCNCANSPSGNVHKTQNSKSNANSNASSPLGSSMSMMVSSIQKEGASDIIVFERKDKEFAEFYSTVHAENLQSMPKDQLVKHYMSLEEKVAVLQKKVAEAQKQKNTNMKSAENDQDKDSVAGSDTNSLSSANEEFVDLSTMNRPSIAVGEDSAI